ncbi:MAG: phytanoyl-CoA dioxygenase family protein [Verrucomicrobiota bacterium]
MLAENLTPSDLAKYHADGFIIIRQLFDLEEITLLSQAAKQDRALDQNAFSKDDGSGAKIRLSLWNHPGDGVYGMFARCQKLVDPVETLLGDEAYHYHSKMIMKDAKVGGAWAWHQDYGYWYQNGVLTPNLCSVAIAVDPATTENGCMQVLKGSHHIGRIDHTLSGDQAGADLERVEEAKKRFPLVDCVMLPGDALFFHSNLLHASAKNDSDHPRWSMICCYNAKSNDPYKDSHHPRYTPLKKVPNYLIKEVGKEHFLNDSSPIDWMKASDDTSASSLEKDSPTA